MHVRVSTGIPLLPVNYWPCKPYVNVAQFGFSRCVQVQVIEAKVCPLRVQSYGRRSVGLASGFIQP